MPPLTPDAILTVDLEDWYHVNYGSASPASSTPPASHVVEHTQILLEIFRRHGWHATFFTLGVVAREHPDLIRTIAEEGHEVACHGDQHVLVPELGPVGLREDLRRAKEAIEGACGVTPEGFRAPSWSISPPRWRAEEAEMWPLEILAEEGFAYDSSLFPFKTYLYGVSGAPTRAHRVVLPSGESIFELPAAVATLFGHRWPFGGGFYFRLLPLFLTRLLCRRYLRREAAPFMYYIHPREISTHQPGLELAFRDHLIHTVNLGRNRAKLEKLLSEFTFCTARDFLNRHRDALAPLPAIH